MSKIIYIILTLFILSGMTISSAQIDVPVQPSAGNKWIQTFNDDFNGTSIDTSKWRGGYSHLQWCGGGNCADTYSGINVNNGILELRPTIDKTNFALTKRAMIHTGGLNLADSKFAQRFGYFTARIKMPAHSGAKGYWLSFWILPLEKTNQNRKIYPKEYEEADVVESWLTDDIYQTHFNLHDLKINSYSLAYPSPTGSDLASAYHDYGLYWKDDGASGTMQVYFDGKPQGVEYKLQNTEFWSKPNYMILQVIACSTQVSGNTNPNSWGYELNKCDSTTSIDNPMLVDSVKVYQEVPISGVTPTPTVTPVTSTLVTSKSWIDIFISWVANLFS